MNFAKLHEEKRDGIPEEGFHDISLKEHKFAPKEVSGPTKPNPQKDAMKYLNTLVGLSSFYFAISFVLSQITIVWPKQISMIVRPTSKEFYNGVIGVTW